MSTTVITPVRTDGLQKAEEDVQAPINDTTLRVTIIRAFHENSGKKTRDGVAAYLVEQIAKQMRGLVPDAEIARYPDEKTAGLYGTDPDFPGDPLLPAFQSLMSADIFLLATSTTEYGYAIPASIFSEKLDSIIAQFGNRITGSGKVAGLVVVGGSGALDLASCLLYMLNDYGFVIPAHAVVVHDDGTDKKTDGAIVRSRKVNGQMDRITTSLVRMAKKLKGEEL